MEGFLYKRVGDTEQWLALPSTLADFERAFFRHLAYLVLSQEPASAWLGKSPKLHGVWDWLGDTP